MTKLIPSISAKLLIPLAFILIGVGCDHVGAGQSRNLRVTNGTTEIGSVIGGGDATGVEGIKMDELLVKCYGPNGLNISIYSTSRDNLYALISSGRRPRRVPNLTVISQPLKYSGEQFLLTIEEVPDKSGNFDGHFTLGSTRRAFNAEVSCEKP